MGMFKVTLSQPQWEKGKKMPAEERRNRLISRGREVQETLEPCALKMSRPRSDEYTFFVEGTPENVEAFYNLNKVVIAKIEEIVGETVHQLDYTLDIKRTMEHDHTVKG